MEEIAVKVRLGADDKTKVLVPLRALPEDWIDDEIDEVPFSSMDEATRRLNDAGWFLVPGVTINSGRNGLVFFRRTVSRKPEESEETDKEFGPNDFEGPW